eukprot:scaffold39746_cov74-Cyclotella_meneghiniana.AAC.12
MIGINLNSNGKRRMDSLNFPCTGAKRGKVLSYSSTANYHVQSPGPYQYRESSKPINVYPTADDYANLVFVSSDDEEDAADGEPLVKKRRKDNKKKRVSFGSNIPIIHHLHNTPLASDMTLEEKTTLWLNSEEIDQIKISANSTIQGMRELVIQSHSFEKRATFRELMKTLEISKGNSVRGMEHRVFRRKVSRQVLVDEVLECQRYIRGLYKFGHHMSSDDKIMLLANVSFKRSASASRTAQSNAEYDSIEGHCVDKSSSDDRPDGL